MYSNTSVNLCVAIKVLRQLELRGVKSEAAEGVNQLMEILKQQNVFKLSFLRVFTVRSEDMIHTCWDEVWLTLIISDH